MGLHRRSLQRPRSSEQERNPALLPAQCRMASNLPVGLNFSIRELAVSVT
jgi:hypothetical protein